jgi:hypothetical protein
MIQQIAAKVSVNPKSTWKKDNKFQCELNKIDLLLSNLNNHPLTPFFSTINQEKLKQEIINEGPHTIEIISDIIEHRLFHPVLCHRCLFDESDPLYLLVRREELLSIRENLLMMGYSALRGGGIQGITLLQKLFAQDAFLNVLLFLRSSKGIGKVSFFEFSRSFMQTFNAINQPKSLMNFIEAFASFNGLEHFQSTLQLNRKHHLKKLVYGLIRVLKVVPDFEDLNHLIQGFEVLQHEKLTPIRNNPKVDSINMGVFFGHCLEDLRCGEDKIKAAIEIIKRASSKLFRLSNFKQIITTVIRLQNNKIEGTLIEEIVHDLILKRNRVSKTILQLFLDSHDSKYEEAALKSWINFVKLSQNYWGSIQFDSLEIEELINDLRNNFSGEKSKTLSALAEILDGLTEDRQQWFFEIIMEVFQNLRSVYILDHFISMIRRKELDLDRFLPMSTAGASKYQRLELLNRYCLSRFLSDTLEKFQYPINQYLDRIQLLLDHYVLPTTRGMFLNNLYQCLESDLDLDQWLNELLCSRDDEEKFEKNCDISSITKLQFHEVKPFLRQYAVSMNKDVSFGISRSGIPTTDGSKVFLPESIHAFQDSKTDLYNNRNATEYVAHLLHEIGYHISAGSFLADTRPTLESFPNKDLAHLILNVCEDFRGRAHFRSHSSNHELLYIIDESEKLSMMNKQVPPHWKDHFLQLLVCRGILACTPGDFDKEKKRAEEILLRKSCELYTPADSKIISIKLQTVLDMIVNQIHSLASKTVAHSLLMVKPLYRLICQIVGEDFQYAPEVIPITFDVGGPSKDAFVLTGNSNGGRNREAQLAELADKLSVYQQAEDVSKSVREIHEPNKSNNGNSHNTFYLPTPKTENVRLKNLEELDRSQIPQYDPISGKLKKSMFPVIFKKESRVHPQYSRLYRKYSSVFQVMEQAAHELKNKGTLTENESKDPDELVIDNLIEGIADPARIPFLEIYENEHTQQKKERLAELEIKILVDAGKSSTGHFFETEQVFSAVLHRAFDLLGMEPELYFYKWKDYPERDCPAFDYSNYECRTCEGISKNKGQTTITQVESLESIGRIIPSDRKNEGHVLRYIGDRFQNNRDKSLLIIISSGYQEGGYYDFPEYYEDTLQALVRLKRDDIIIHYFNLGELPKKIYQLLQAQLGKNVMKFRRPKDLVAYAPGFVEKLMDDLVC